MNKCPFFEKCGGCMFDFTATDYKEQKLNTINKIPVTDQPIWLEPGNRRRADFAFSGGKFGLFESKTKNIIPISKCPNLTQEINDILSKLIKLPWVGTGACLITKCDNGIDVAITSDVPYFSAEFKNAITTLPVVRATWNNKVIIQNKKPIIL